MKKYIGLTLILIILFSFSTFAESEKTGTIKGKTYQGAVVYLKDQKQIVGENNRFKFENLQQTKYKIKIVHEDYYSYEKIIKLDKEELDLGFIELPTSKSVKENGDGKVYSNVNEEGEIVVVPLKGGLKGKVPPGAKVSIKDKRQVTGKDGQFTFENLELGKHILTINYKGETIKKEISISRGEMINIGKVELDTSKEDDSIDVANNNNIPDIEKEKEDKKEESSFKIGNIYAGNNFTIMSVNYNTEIKGENYNRSEFSSNGIYDKFYFTIPLTIKKYDFYIDSFLAFANGGTEREKFFLGDSLADYYMVDLSTNEYGVSLRYDYPFKYGTASAGLGRLYYNHEFNKSTFGNDKDKLYKEYRKGQGWNFKGSLNVDFSNVMTSIENINNLIALNKVGFGTDFSFTQSYVDIDSTKYFSSTMVEGNRTAYSFYLTYNNDYNLKAGYRFINYNSKERLEGNLMWPSFQMTYQGPFIDFTIPF